MELRKEFTFEASHILPRHQGKCSRLHGHSWRLTVCVEGTVDPESGFVQDYAAISALVKPVIEQLDHRHLGAWTHLFQKPLRKELLDNMVPALPDDFYPSSENLIQWIGTQLQKEGLDWSKLILNETCTSTCILTRQEWRRNFSLAKIATSSKR